MPKFTVDTHLFRELGELLVGRDSTALVELIKNSYDADAKKVTVYGEALDDLSRGFIRIKDDGVGMTPDEFEQGFLRIASRAKEVGGRLSPKCERRFTGAKGVGRLAAHKLAQVLELTSVPEPLPGRKSLKAIDARIDWSVIEQHETLDELEGTSAVVFKESPLVSTAIPGTVITLRGLRRRWTAGERSSFLTEVQTFEAPKVLTSPLRDTIVSRPLLFEQPIVRETVTGDPGFSVVLDGEFATGEDYWQALAEVADWIIEVDAARQDGKIHYAITPTLRTLRVNPDAEGSRLSVNHPEAAGPFFQARIFVREGRLPGSFTNRSWVVGASGIRVFLEGFRVLPYGEPKNDWLSLDADYTRRARVLRTIGRGALVIGEADRDVGLVILPNAAYFGGVFLTERRAPSLRLLVNREGFVPDRGFQFVTEFVRLGVDLGTRTRAAARLQFRERRRQERAGRGKVFPIREIEPSLRRARELVEEAESLSERGSVDDARARIGSAIRELSTATPAIAEVVAERSMLRVLASVGTQMAALIHEINGIVGQSEAIETALGRIRDRSSLPKLLRRDLSHVIALVGELRRSLEKQASYLVDVVRPDARRRRTRHDLAARFDSATRLVEHLASQRGIRIENRIPSGLRSPKMFQAELVAVFANLLTNAVKAAGRDGQIRSLARELENGSVRLVIENTGVAVDPEKGEKWFRPFKSTTATVDPVLGQGMGLGLPITRNILEEYGATIRFSRPSKGFQTAVELLFPA